MNTGSQLSWTGLSIYTYLIANVDISTFPTKYWQATNKLNIISDYFFTLFRLEIKNKIKMICVWNLQYLDNVIYQNKDQSPSGTGNHNRLLKFVFHASRDFNYWAFQSFDFDLTRRRLFQKRVVCTLRRVWRWYRRGNQNPYFKDEQTTQWQKKKYKRTNNDQQNMHIKLKIE